MSSLPPTARFIDCAFAALPVTDRYRFCCGGCGLQVDLLVCDANDHVACMRQFLGPVLCKLKPGGWLVVTLKFHGRGQKSDDFAAQMAGMLPVSGFVAGGATALLM